MKTPDNPFSEAVLRIAHQVFSELVIAARSGNITPDLITTAEASLKSQRAALTDLGVNLSDD